MASCVTRAVSAGVCWLVSCLSKALKTFGVEQWMGGRTRMRGSVGL